MASKRVRKKARVASLCLRTSWVVRVCVAECVCQSVRQFSGTHDQLSHAAAKIIGRGYQNHQNSLGSRGETSSSCADAAAATVVLVLVLGSSSSRSSSEDTSDMSSSACSCRFGMSWTWLSGEKDRRGVRCVRNFFRPDRHDLGSPVRDTCGRNRVGDTNPSSLTSYGFLSGSVT